MVIGSCCEGAGVRDGSGCMTATSTSQPGNEFCLAALCPQPSLLLMSFVKWSVNEAHWSVGGSAHTMFLTMLLTMLIYNLFCSQLIIG